MARGSAGLRARAARRGRLVPPRALVTGTSSGIGRATAERLRDRGWTVYASVRVPGQAPEGTEEVVFDVTDPVAIGHASTRVETLDALVENAGIAIAGPLELLPAEELRRQLDVNVVGQLRVLQAFLPAVRRARGRIVLMGSVAGRSSLPFLGAYAMSKFALEALADALRVEVAPWGIHVALVEPATIDTPIWRKPQPATRELPPEAAELYGERIERFRKLAASRSSGAGVPPGKVAEAVEHALTARRPRTRYLVGPDARRRSRLQLLPDRLRDRILTRYLFGNSRT